MKISIININNYEAFLLDKIEGNLSADLSRELTIFLENNNLEDCNEEDLVYLDDNDFQGSIGDIYLMSDDLKRTGPSLNEEKMIFEAVEGNLEQESERTLKAWVANDTILKQHYEAMLATRTANDTLTYPNKSSLKRREPVVRYLYMLAAACVLGFLFFFNPASTEINDAPVIVSGQNINKEVPEQDMKENNGQNSENIKNLNNSPENMTAVEDHENGKNIIPSGLKHETVIATENRNSVAENKVNNDRSGNEFTPEVNDNSPARMALTNLPRIARLGSERVMSIEPKSAIINNYQSRRIRDEEPLLAGAVNSIKEKIDYVDRKSAAIYGFADFQKNIIQSEGLFEVSKDRTPDGKVEGYSLRIAGFELSTAK